LNEIRNIKVTMRTLLNFAAIAALADAGFTIINEVDEECWFNENATYVNSCFDLYYWHCDKYEINADSSCIVRTMSDTSIATESEFITAAYWSFAKNTSWINETESNATDSSSFSSFGLLADITGKMGDFVNAAATKLNSEDYDEIHSRAANPDWVDPFEADCYQLDPSPVSIDIEQNEKINFFGGLCGFKIQITNSNEVASLPFNLLRDGASSLVAGAAILAGAAALF